MTRSRSYSPLLVLALVAAALAAVAAARGSDSAARTPAAVSLRTTSLGKILVDSRGRTLYLFEADHGTKSACYGKCAAFWPPLLTSGRPTAGTGIEAARLGTTRRTDGKLQVTYARHPLYRFAKDTKAGMTAGEGVVFFGGGWYVLSAAGKKVVRPAANSTTTTPAAPPTTTGGGYGGGYGG